MYQCPKCNSFMKFNMRYVCGKPHIFYTCSCGYSTDDETYTATTTTKGLDNESYLVENTEYGNN